MKSTYKLLGKFWDRRPELKAGLEMLRGPIDCPDYKQSYDLFDVKKYVRSVKISEFLRLDDGKRVDSVLEKVKHCDMVVVKLDFSFENDNKIVQNFLSKRVSQCLKYMQEYLGCKKLKITVASPIEPVKKSL